MSVQSNAVSPLQSTSDQRKEDHHPAPLRPLQPLNSDLSSASSPYYGNGSRKRGSIPSHLTGKSRFVAKAHKIVTINLLSKPLNGIVDSNAESQSHNQSPPTTGRSPTSPRFNSSSINASSKRITNAQLQWRMALQRPATCEKNLKDLDNFRADYNEERKQQSNVIDAEAVERRLIGIVEGEQRDILARKYQRLLHYLARLALSERVKKATVDKHNEKIHNLFQVAQSDDRQRREKRKKDCEEERHARIEMDKIQAHLEHENTTRETVLAQRERQLTLAQLRQEAKELRAQTRLELLHKKRQNASAINEESQLRTLKNEANKAELIHQHQSKVKNARQAGLPIHTFLRLPPLTAGSPKAIESDNVDEVEESTTHPSQKSIFLQKSSNNAFVTSMNSRSRSSATWSRTGNVSSTALPEAARRIKQRKHSRSRYDIPSDDEDPYGIRDKRTYHHTGIILRDDSVVSMIDEGGNKATQTNSNWMDTLPSDSDMESDLEYTAAMETSQTIVLSAIEAAVTKGSTSAL